MSEAFDFLVTWVKGLLDEEETARFEGILKTRDELAVKEFIKLVIKKEMDSKKDKSVSKHKDFCTVAMRDEHLKSSPGIWNAREDFGEEEYYDVNNTLTAQLEDVIHFHYRSAL